MSREVKVPRWSRLSLVRPSCLSALLTAAVFTAACVCGDASAQQLNDSDSTLLAPALDGNPRSPPRFQTAPKKPNKDEGQSLGVPQLPSFGSAPASGAGATGFDSSNGGRRKSQSKSKGPAKTPGFSSGGMGSRGNGGAKANQNGTSSPQQSTANPGTNGATTSDPDTRPAPLPPRLLQPASAPPLLTQLRTQSRPGAPPLSPEAETVTVATLPPSWRPLIDPKPFDPLGVQVGAFNLLPGVDYSRGYDTNPRRLGLQPISGSWFDLYSGGFLASSNWDRHGLTASLLGTYTTYDTAHSQDRPTAEGRINGRIDVSSFSQINLEGRFILGTDAPGSPNIQADLAHFPIYTTLGGSAGYTQRFNRLELTFKGGVDRTVFQPSEFVNGLTDSNSDRNYNEYSTTLCAAYDLSPSLRPFAEVSGNERRHDLPADRFALERDSAGYSAKAGADIDIAGTLAGKFALGYLNQMYIAPLPNVGGFLVEGALVWAATALTKATLSAATTLTESPLFLTSALFTRQVGFQVDHAFRRWLIGTAKFAVAHDIYAGSGRVDDRYTASVAISYMLARELWLKGEYRQEWERANIPGSNYVASVWLLGVRLQR